MMSLYDPPDTTFSGSELCRMTARDVVAALRRAKVTPQELIDAALARSQAVSPAINATVTLCEDRARAAAPLAPVDSVLAGLPLGIKDLNPVAGVRTTYGTQAFADHVPDTSDWLVERIEARGGLVLGKTNTPELGAGANTFNAVFGATRNPWNTSLNAGGSSGGAAAALVTGETWLSHGSDLGGSLRTPAAYCRVVGLRPSYGLVTNTPGPTVFDAMGVEGPMARNVADAALFLDAMTGLDLRNPRSHAPDVASYLSACLQDPGPMRIAFSPDLGGLAPVTSEMADALSAAMTRLDTSDLRIDETAPDTSEVNTTFRTLRALGFWASARQTPDDVTQHFKATLKQNIAEGQNLTVEAVTDAMLARTRIFAKTTAFLADYDAIACPVVGLMPEPVEHEYPSQVAGVPSADYLDWLRLAFLASLCGLPALSVPIGFTAQGLPVGLQLIGRPHGEARLLQLGRVIEEHLALPLTPIDPRLP